MMQGFADELTKLAEPVPFLSPARLHALVTGMGAGATGGAIGNVINPSPDIQGRRKGTVGQAVKGATLGGATYLAGQALYDLLKRSKVF